MRPTHRRFRILATAIALAIASTGCFLSKSEKHLESMDESTRRMAAQLQAYEAYIAQLTQHLGQLTASIVALQTMMDQGMRMLLTPQQTGNPTGPQPEVPDLEDLLGGPVEPGPLPTSEASPLPTTGVLE